MSAERDLVRAVQYLLDDMNDADETHDGDGVIFDSVENAAAALVENGGFLNWYSKERAAEYRKRNDPNSRPDLETPKMLVLSTAHVTKATNGGLMTKAQDMMDRQCRPEWPVVFEKGEYGYILPMIDERDDHERWAAHPDLAGIRQLAEANGCSWVMLDRDADVIDELPSYDW